MILKKLHAEVPACELQYSRDVFTIKTIAGLERHTHDACALAASFTMSTVKLWGSVKLCVM